ncbi:MAG TPA: L-threonylcarbamoyladenylate synthase [Spirochaetales bacterium]|nr:L-threonylcarbamoyladenylate synthase [Spirochaetales bacterium]
MIRYFFVMLLLDSSDQNLRAAGSAIAQGKIVAIPTETVYGLGADAFNAQAVAKIFAAKNRPTFDPLIVHVASASALDTVVRLVPPKARILVEALWPGPLTLVMPKREAIPDIVTAGLDTVGVRCPSHPVARKIIEYSGTAVAAPSANPFGYISPTTAMHVAKQLGDRVDMIIDGGPCAVGVESTVIDMTHEIPIVLRPGGMPLERIQELIGELAFPEKELKVFASPGQLKSHYAPHADLLLFEEGALARIDPASVPAHAAAIAFDTSMAEQLREATCFDMIYVLSPKGNILEAAANLFAVMRTADEAGFSTLYAERVPDAGLGRAINDRLYRASKKS